MEEKYAGLKAFMFPLFCTLIMWLLFFLHWNLKIDLTDFGIIPRTLKGLFGIITAPFIHHDFNHLVSNTLPVLIVGTGLFYFYRSIAFRVLGMIFLLTGLWVWMFARTSSHIGASGVVYGLVCFLFFSGMIRKDRRLLATSLLVTFLYGSLVWGILPVDLTVSWESHLFGSAAGIFAAIYYRKLGPTREKYLWELEEEMEQSNLQESTNVSVEQTDINIQYHYTEEGGKNNNQDKG